VVETAIAFAAGKPLVIYKHDVRSVFSGSDNSMLSGLAEGHVVNDLHRIPDALERAATRLSDPGGRRYGTESCPPAMARTLTLGRRIWAVLARLPRGAGKPDHLLEEIAEMCSTDGRAT